MGIQPTTRALGLLALAALAGCFERNYPAGLPCGPDSLCPPGQSCDSDNFCRVNPKDVLDGGGSVDGRLVGNDAAGPPDAMCPTTTIVLTPDQDGMFVSTAGVNPNMPYGGFPIANIGVGIHSVGVFRFDLALLDVEAEVLSGSLEIFHNRFADDCGGSCGSCSGIDKDGVMTLHYLRSDWNEGTYDAFTPWQEANAAAVGVDRSEEIATTDYVAPTSATFDFSVAEYSSWRQNDKLSFLVVPSEGAVLVSTTKEPTGCAVDTLATLSLRYCTE